jgi:PiT family inorganic phosphate transporter
MAVAVGLAILFAFTNGIHDASNAIAALVATRAARPLQAVVLAAIFNVLGPLVVGSAVADTIGGIVTVGGSVGVEVIGAGLLAAVAWNVLTWALGLPSSSGHALVGGLVGAALVAGGSDAIRWGGFEGGHPAGVIGTLVTLGRSSGTSRWAGSSRCPRPPSWPPRQWASGGGCDATSSLVPARLTGPPRDAPPTAVRHDRGHRRVRRVGAR